MSSIIAQNVGVDISKATLDVHLHPAGSARQFANDAKGIKALLSWLGEWAAQPDFVYTHHWNVGDLVFWNNHGSMHRVVPYTDEERSMHRTTIASNDRPGRVAAPEEVAKILEPVI